MSPDESIQASTFSESQSKPQPHRGSRGILTPLPQQNTIERYAIALACAAISVVLRALLEPLLGHAGFYVTVYLAVIFCALVCGMWPSIVCALLATAGVVYWFVDTHGTFVVHDRREIHGLVACFLICPALIALGEANRRKQLRLNEAHERLEQRVAERTSELSNALVNLESEMGVRQQVEEQLRQLSVHLMTIQDDERRRIARDLHDSAGQTLAAIRMTLAMLEQAQSSGDGSEKTRVEKLFSDLNSLTDEALKEIRTTSYLLHPPLLDEAGFCSAARWFVAGFTKRSGIQVQCEIPEHSERLPEAVELALFRVLQESLTNIHRHSGATAAIVRFVRNPTGIELQVSDNGRGLSSEQLKRLRESDGGGGVGVAGMRERIRGLGGQIALQSNGKGMTITASLAEPHSLSANSRPNGSAA
jgi:signal transduction histidine kinase